MQATHSFQIKETKRKKLSDTKHVSESQFGQGEYTTSGQLASNNDEACVELVIPLPSSFRSSDSNVVCGHSSNKSASSSLESQAAIEIVNELNGIVSPEDKKNPTITLNNCESLHGDKPRQPLLLSNLPDELLGVMTDEERFRKDVSLRANDIFATSSAYDSIPIDQFGAAMLRGMGWTGATNEEKELLDKQYAPVIARESRVGLGAIAKPPDKSTRSNNETKEKNRTMWVQKSNEKISSQQISNGQFVWIRNPLYAGRRGVVVATQGVPGLDSIRIAMESDGSLIEVRKKDIVHLTEDQLKIQPYVGSSHVGSEALPNMTNNMLHHQSSLPDAKSGATRKRKSENEPSNSKQDYGDDRDKKMRKESKDIKWLRSGIRVRIISKKAGGTSTYLQKASVVDVYEDGVASLRLDVDGSVLEGVKQKYLETVLPLCGQSVIVLFGVHCGQSAQLLEKRKDEQNAVVQLCEEMEIVVVQMDQIAALSS